MSMPEAPLNASEPTADTFGLVGHELEKKWRVDRVVAEGGFGVVYAAQHTGLDVPVALKVLKVPPELAPEARSAFIEKFTLEAKTMARINHPNIVRVTDTGATEMPAGGVAPWMVMEWLAGQTLEDIFYARKGQGGFPVEQAFALMKPAFEAFAYAHDEGIAHRDIKPANVMIIQGKRGPQLRVLDFGIAKLMQRDETAGTGHTATRSTFNAFSPQYAAPEQIGGSRTGPWTDVHALGLVFVEALTGRQPYGDSEDVTALFQEILSPVRPTPAKFGVDVGQALEAVLRKAVAFKPEDRFPNGAELLAAIEAALPNTRGGSAVFGALGPGFNPGVISSPGGVSTPGGLSGQFPAVPGSVVPGAATANFGTPNVPGSVPAGMPPMQSGPYGQQQQQGPTTMRGAAFVSDVDNGPVAVPTNSSKGLVIVGVSALVAVGLVAFAVAMRGPAPATPVAASTGASVVSAAPSGLLTAAPSVIAMPSVAPVPSVLLSAVPTAGLLVAPSVLPSGLPTVMPSAIQLPTAVASVPAHPSVAARPSGAPRPRPTARPRPTGGDPGGYTLE